MRTLPLFTAAALSMFAATLQSSAEDFSGFVALSRADDPRSLALQGGSFSTAVYEDKANTCPGANTTLANIRHVFESTNTGWVRISYKDCKENFALVCVDPDLDAKAPPTTCASVGTEVPPDPNILETFAGAVAPSVSAEKDDPTMTFTGNVFNVTLAPDAKNVCQGKDNYPAVKKLVSAIGDDKKVRITYKSCGVDNALVCIDTGLDGPFNAKVCVSFARQSQGD